MSSAASKFFKGTQFNVCLAIYDTRRGQAEGHEADKLLAFYPGGAPASMQSSVVGLAQALTVFGATFTTKASPFHTMEADNHRWVMYNCEPGIWFLLVANRAWLGHTTSPAALHALLQSLHAAAALLHGSIGGQLEADPGGQAARARLQPLLHEAATRLVKPEHKERSALASPLGVHEGCPFLTLSRAVFTELQALVSQLLISSVCGSRLVHGVVACYHQALLWSTLNRADTGALWQLASRAILPAAKAGPRSKLPRRPAAGTAAAAAGGGAGGGGGGPVAAWATGSNTLLNPACWEVQQSGLVLPVPGCGGGDAAATAAAARGDGGGGTAGASGALPLPRLWLQGGEERCRLLVQRTGPLVVLLLLQDCPAALQPGTAAMLSDILGPRCGLLVGQLAAEVPAVHLWHVQGLRYHYRDDLCGASRASPQVKVATLAAQSLSLAADVHALVGWEEAAAPQVRCAAAVAGGTGGTADDGRAAGSGRSAGGGGEGAAGGARVSGSGEGSDGAVADLEVAARGAHDCWVVARETAAGRRLCVVLEGDKDGSGLGAAADRIQRFCDVHFPGTFDGL